MSVQEAQVATPSAKIGPPARRQKVKFLTAIWGARYIEEFARVSLPSYLAPGNLPALADATDLEVFIMTSEASQEAFDQETLIAKLKKIAAVRFIYIDDLITTGNYGVTLTLAYARGIAATGSEQTNTFFVFMNSDFVLADGSLRSLASRLNGSHSCIMAASLRACAEPVMPLLRQAVDQRLGHLSMSPRSMVRLTLDHLHPTVIAKTVTQQFVTCSTHNQLYWQVDGNTLLARGHLIFMLAIKPEVPLRAVNSYCDYGFVPELVPSGSLTVIGDSDEFYMMELQATGQEGNFLRCGLTTGQKQIAKELSGWTTKEHRRFAQVDTVFHSADLPPSLESVRAAAAKYVSELQAAMTPPIDHVDHFYWVLGVQAWMQMSESAGEDFKLPPELLDLPSRDISKALLQGKAAQAQRRMAESHAVRSTARQALYLGSMAFARRCVYGIKPIVPVWHHEWQDCRLLWQTINQARRDKTGRHLLVWDAQTWLPGWLRRTLSFEICMGTCDFIYRTKAQVANKRLPRHGEGQELFSSAIVYVRRANVREARVLVESIAEHIKPGAQISVYIEHPDAALDGSNFSVELAQYITHVLPASWMNYSVTASFVGGHRKRQLAGWKLRLTRALWPLSPMRLPRAIVAGALFPFVAGATAIDNLLSRGASTTCPDWCTSALVVLSPLKPAAAAPSDSPATAAPKLVHGTLEAAQ